MKKVLSVFLFLSLSVLLVAPDVMAKGSGSGSKISGGRARSAVSGKYVKKSYAAKQPKTTVTESTQKKK